MEKTINTIEELQNLVELMQRALNFYSNKENYKSSCPINGEIYSPIELDEGFQAQFALDLAKQVADKNQKMQEDYDKLIMEAESILDFSDEETSPMDLLRVFVETHKDDKNI
jgi:hypothetical protein